MSRKDYIAVANEIAALPPGTRGNLTKLMIDIFKRGNPSFDRARFIQHIERNTL